MVVVVRRGVSRGGSEERELVVVVVRRGVSGGGSEERS